MSLTSFVAGILLVAARYVRDADPDARRWLLAIHTLRSP